MAYSIPWNLIGINVSGDIGDLTIYTDRFGKKVPFPKSPPKEPPSPEQTQVRNRFRSAQQTYMALSDSEKLAYEELTKKLSLMMTGQNLWISISMKGDVESLQTMMRQSGVTVPIPPLNM